MREHISVKGSQAGRAAGAKSAGRTKGMRDFMTTRGREILCEYEREVFIFTRVVKRPRGVQSLQSDETLFSK